MKSEHLALIDTIQKVRLSKCLAVRPAKGTKMEVTYGVGARRGNRRGILLAQVVEFWKFPGSLVHQNINNLVSHKYLVYITQ